MNEWTSCWCFGTPDWCSGTPACATALLLREQARPDRCSGTPAGATALLLRGQARPERCFGTPAAATALLFCIVPLGTYFTTSYSFLMIDLGSHIDI